MLHFSLFMSLSGKKLPLLSSAGWNVCVCAWGVSERASGQRVSVHVHTHSRVQGVRPIVPVDSFVCSLPDFYGLQFLLQWSVIAPDFPAVSCFAFFFVFISPCVEWSSSFSNVCFWACLCFARYFIDDVAFFVQFYFVFWVYYELTEFFVWFYCCVDVMFFHDVLYCFRYPRMYGMHMVSLYWSSVFWVCFFVLSFCLLYCIILTKCECVFYVSFLFLSVFIFRDVVGLLIECSDDWVIVCCGMFWCPEEVLVRVSGFSVNSDFLTPSSLWWMFRSRNDMVRLCSSSCVNFMFPVLSIVWTLCVSDFYFFSKMLSTYLFHSVGLQCVDAV